jgi:hypothetical protein
VPVEKLSVPVYVFVPDREPDLLTDSHVNSLTAIDGHDRQYFNELCSTVVSRQIFIRS